MKRISYVMMMVFAAMLTMGWTSCTDEEVNETKMIIRPWNLISKKVLGVETLNEPCERDDVWNFKSDGSYTIDPKEKCGDEAMKTGTWSLSADGSSLTLNGVEVFEVVEISLSKLVIQMKVAGVGLTVWTFD
jgi:hypothetical protein